MNGVFVQTNDFFLDRVPRSGTYFFEDWLGACGCDPPQTMLRLNILESGNAPHYLRVFSGLTYKDGVIAGPGSVLPKVIGRAALAFGSMVMYD